VGSQRSDKWEQDQRISNFTTAGFAQPIWAALRQTKDIIGTDTIVIAKSNQMLDWHFLLATLVFTYLIFGCSQNNGNFSLGFIVICSQITDFLCILTHRNTPLFIVYAKYITTPNKVLEKHPKRCYNFRDPL